MSFKVLSLVFPGMTLIDLAGPLQALSFIPGFESQLAWKHTGALPSDAGVSVVATHGFDDCWEAPDLLFVPGNTKALFALLEDEQTKVFLARVGARSTWITSVCNGSLLLAAAGLLDGYRAGCYWYARDRLALLGAIPSPGRIVIDRNRMTGGGMTAGIDFGVRVVGEIAGEATGRMVELLMEYAPQPPYGTGRPELCDEALVAGAREALRELMPLGTIERVAAARR